MRGKTQYYKEKHFIRKAEVISSPCLEPPGVYWPYSFLVNVMKQTYCSVFVLLLTYSYLLVMDL